ncbi:heme-binding protein [Halobacteriales archaeon Cl-PHB]
MPDRRDPPPTDEGWYALHDFRTIDWDAWRDAPERDQDRAVEDAVAHLDSLVAVEDADEGATAVYSILGHEADLLLMHLRPTTAHLDAVERGFEQTEFAEYTTQTESYVSVTEASGYSERARSYFEGELDPDSGLAKYIRSRLYPTVPDATHVCFYPMDKRRDPEQNWYDLPFDERAEHMDAHGEIGRDYGGKVTQMITGSIGLDDWEWGVTLWADDLVDVKDLLYEMRFDPSTSQFAEFGEFFVGRRFPPGDLSAFMAGEAVPTDADVQGATGKRPGESSHPGHGGDSGHGASQAEGGEGDSGGPPPGVAGGDGDDGAEAEEVEDLEGRLATLGLHEGKNYEAGDYGVVLYSTADAQDLASEVDDLRGHFEEYDSHVETVVRAEGGRSAVASVWDTERAADTAAGFLGDLPDIVESVRGPLGEGAAGETRDESGDDESESIREELADLDVYAGQPHGEDVYALVAYSEADLDDLVAETDDLADGFDRYDTHEGTKVYEDTDGDTAAVVSLWATDSGADKAADFISDLPGIVGWADEGDGFGTMGMFYTVKPEHREDFVETFGEVGGLLADMEGHRETSLLKNVEDATDMFIASQWDGREDAMAFFRSDAFSDTVEWGRDVLADRPRHVFLA